MTIKQKQCLLAYMGTLAPEDIDGLWGGISAAATEQAQKMLSIPEDGVWGPQTDTAIREYIFSGEDLLQDDLIPTGDWWDGIRYWTREEFRCRCGEYHTPYCNGFPVEPDRTLVELVDDIRHELGVRCIRSSGIRCEQHNADEGGVSNSRHRSGKALDFMAVGKTAQEVLAVAQKDKRCRYAYIIGNGPYVHVDVN